VEETLAPQKTPRLSQTDPQNFCCLNNTFPATALFHMDFSLAGSKQPKEVSHDPQVTKFRQVTAITRNRLCDSPRFFFLLTSHKNLQKIVDARAGKKARLEHL
jgi:hypothetical protein